MTAALSLPRPYYDEGGVTIYHGDCRDILPRLGAFGLLCTDPPYDERTAKNARGAGGADAGRGFVDRGVGSMTVDALREVLALCGEHMAPPAWGVMTLPWKWPAYLEDAPPAGWNFIREGVWVKPDGAPQFSGDRPGVGFEAIAILHTNKGGRMRWNGGGRRAVWTHGITRDVTGHPTIKPLALVREWVALFSDAGQAVLDPFMGSGTTLRAAKDLGRPVVGIEINERYCELAAKRLAQEVLFS